MRMQPPPVGFGRLAAPVLIVLAPALWIAYFLTRETTHVVGYLAVLGPILLTVAALIVVFRAVTAKR